MKKILLFLCVSAVFAFVSCSTDTMNTDTGSIKVILGQCDADSVQLGAVAPRLFDVSCNFMFATPGEMQNVPVEDGKAFFHTDDAPALYCYGLDVLFLAMPGDQVTLDFTDSVDYPEISGPKATVDAFEARRKTLAIENDIEGTARSAGADEAELSVAHEKCQAALKELFLENKDNAGSVGILLHIDRKDWDSLLPMIPESVYAHPLVAPTYSFMKRCVILDLKPVPVKFENMD